MPSKIANGMSAVECATDTGNKYITTLTYGIFISRWRCREKKCYGPHWPRPTGSGMRIPLLPENGWSIFVNSNISFMVCNLQEFQAKRLSNLSSAHRTSTGVCLRTVGRRIRLLCGALIFGTKMPLGLCKILLRCNPILPKWRKVFRDFRLRWKDWWMRWTWISKVYSRRTVSSLGLLRANPSNTDVESCCTTRIEC